MRPTGRARSTAASLRAWSASMRWSRPRAGVKTMDASNQQPDFSAMCRAAVADEPLLRQMLMEADTVPQALIHAQLTGDESLLRKAAGFIEGGWGHMQRIPEELRAEIREVLIGTLTPAAAGKLQDWPLTQHGLSRLLGYGVNHLVPDDYGTMFMEEAAPQLGRMRTARWRRDPEAATLAAFPVIIAGAGTSGLCMAIMLQQAGI